MTVLRVDTIQSASDGANITIGDSDNSMFAALPANTMIDGSTVAVASKQTIGFALTDETDGLTGEISSMFHLPYNFTVTEISVGLKTAHNGIITVTFTSGSETREAVIASGSRFQTTVPSTGTVPGFDRWVLNANATIAVTSTITGEDGVGLKVYLTGNTRG